MGRRPVPWVTLVAERSIVLIGRMTAYDVRLICVEVAVCLCSEGPLIHLVVRHVEGYVVGGAFV